MYVQPGKQVRAWLSDKLSPACPPQYVGCVSPQSLSLQTGNTRVQKKCPSVSSRGFDVQFTNYVKVGEQKNTTLSNRLSYGNVSSFLKYASEPCPLDILLLYDDCGQPTDINAFKRVEILKDALVTAYDRDEVGGYSELGMRDDVFESITLDVNHYYDFMRPSFSLAGASPEACSRIYSTEVHHYKPCDGCDEVKILIVTGVYEIIEYGTLLYVFFSTDNGQTWISHPVFSLGYSYDLTDVSSTINIVNDEAIIVVNHAYTNTDYLVIYNLLDLPSATPEIIEIPYYLFQHGGIDHVAFSGNHYIFFMGTGSIFRGDIRNLNNLVRLYDIDYTIGLSFGKPKYSNGIVYTVRTDGTTYLFVGNKNTLDIHRISNPNTLARITDVHVGPNFIYGVDSSGVMWYKTTVLSTPWTMGVNFRSRASQVTFDEHGVISYVVTTQGLLLSIDGGATYQRVFGGSEILSFSASSNLKYSIFATTESAVYVQVNNSFVQNNGRVSPNYNQLGSIPTNTAHCGQGYEHGCAFSGVFGELDWSVICGEGSIYLRIYPRIFTTECVGYSFVLRVTQGGVSQYYTIDQDAILNGMLIGPIDVSDLTEDLQFVVWIEGTGVDNCLYRSTPQIMVVPCTIIGCEGDDCVGCSEVDDSLVFCYDC